ncbi:beta-galactosidase small subunit [Lacticaseibacillus suilingensis]|jgi:beta-galactosidase|uniref:beta-galactosidase n=1 Tax=Lacticaseibacillus suilingensis TaxID=2799577 RepID=A0ABW4BI66_9LACO|nr:beta-galactosidase small subunit [Lacticaseibacillus suilingensis]MCI1895283.1 beta-galactosidase small subunit [Lactobacillus sp.]
MVNSLNSIEIIPDGEVIGSRTPRMHCIFDRHLGLVSLRTQGREWLYRAPQPAYWRGTTDNDRGRNGKERFPIRAAGWYSSDMFPSCVSCDATIDEEPVPIEPSEALNSQALVLKYTYETLTKPSTNVTITYRLTTTALHVAIHFTGDQALPPLPAFGYRWTMPTPAQSFAYNGLSGETYPDRMHGAHTGEFEIAGMPMTPYLVPQDCGVHMRTKKVAVTRTTTLNNAQRDTSPVTLTFQADNDFAFSCLPYTPEEIESAEHQDELPPIRRTVLTLLGAVRGVGGIDSWGADVTPEATIDVSKDIDFGFTIF